MTDLPPPGEGVRLGWDAVPAAVRTSIQLRLGAGIVSLENQPGGFSPGVAARVTLADGRLVFLKVGGPVPNPELPAIYRRERLINEAMPIHAPVPRLLWSDEPDEWVVMAFECLEGRQPNVPWVPAELETVAAAIQRLSTELTPCPIRPPTIPVAPEVFRTAMCSWSALQGQVAAGEVAVDSWIRRHFPDLIALDREAVTAVAGDTLVNLDLRADNILIGADEVWFVDWPQACQGAQWLDIVLMAPSVAMQSGPEPEDLIARHPAARAADRHAITAVVAAMAGYFTHRSLQPPPPGLPTVRAFQSAQAVVARRWLAQRLAG